MLLARSLIENSQQNFISESYYEFVINYINDHQYKFTIPTIVSYIIALVQWGLICIVVAMDIFTHTDSLTTE